MAAFGFDGVPPKRERQRTLLPRSPTLYDLFPSFLTSTRRWNGSRKQSFGTKLRPETLKMTETEITASLKREDVLGGAMLNHRESLQTAQCHR